jgi:hypothetical protein
MYALGQTVDEWYRRALDAAEAFDSLLKRSAYLADEGLRGEILLWVGRPDVPGSPAERYSRVTEDLAEVNSVDPPAFSFYTEPVAVDRVTDLEAVLQEFYGRMTDAEKAGLLPGAEDAQKPEARVPADTFTVFGLASIAAIGLGFTVVYG